MTAKQAFGLVVGMIILTFSEAMIKSYVIAFPFTEAVAAQWSGVVTFLTTKVVNDTKEMRYLPESAAKKCNNGG